MCLFPSGAPYYCDDATVRFKRKLVIAALCCHGLLVVLDFVCFSWWDAILDVLALSIGYCSIREPDFYEVTRLLCYVMFLIFDFVFAGVKCCLFFSGVAGAPAGKNKNWQYYAYVGLVIASTAYYFIGGCVAYSLYKSLKRYHERTVGIAAQNPAPENYGGAAAAGRFGGGQRYQRVRDEEQPPPQEKKFPGEGYTLGAGAPASRQPRSNASRPNNSSASNNRNRQSNRPIPAAALARMEANARNRGAAPSS
mmetsp:Transcript_2792/g.4054  ORF Transcript_2792/g.4054 Transcript_2792/m.4054 type:complete len:252 (-) Transcript_2792:172-927(-)|eukprot:CAMPEP_0167761812 /NCGR_PEP_ID=MMETSP0110_2-20121227/12392_1 /TAXON_ID=629695 /ORGANISM="Gymnochlora sp., Strain CCMP2014" /LENGTH=251 /DNA_ID=CAMNT_0007648561 /DNA_START=52 /DNA_END=810 /DNA_ORIENTATION=-